LLQTVVFVRMHESYRNYSLGCLLVELSFSLQELTDKMKAFIEKYEQNADGKIGIIEVRKLKTYAILIFFNLNDLMRSFDCLNM